MEALAPYKLTSSLRCCVTIETRPIKLVIIVPNYTHAQTVVTRLLAERLGTRLDQVYVNRTILLTISGVIMRDSIKKATRPIARKRK